MPRSIMPAAILSLAIVFGGLVSFAGENGLSQYTAAKKPVNVFLKDFSNESGQSATNGHATRRRDQARVGLPAQTAMPVERG